MRDLAAQVGPADAAIWSAVGGLSELVSLSLTGTGKEATEMPEECAASLGRLGRLETLCLRSMGLGELRLPAAVRSLTLEGVAWPTMDTEALVLSLIHI